MRESGIALLKFVRPEPESEPEAGLDQEVRYFDGAGKPQPDRSGAYGFRYIFDARGLQVGDILVSYDGEDIPDVRTFVNEFELIMCWGCREVPSGAIAPGGNTPQVVANGHSVGRHPAGGSP